jgi:hypothetical protein
MAKYTYRVTEIKSKPPFDRYGSSYLVEVLDDRPSFPIWRCQYGGLNMGDGNGAADLAHFAGRQVIRTLALGFKP